MLRIGDVELGDVARVAVPLADADLQTGGKTAADMADIFELRVDQFSKHTPDHVAQACAFARGFGVPLIGTVRARAEGGESDIPDPLRLDLYKAMAPHVDAFDVEHFSGIRGELVMLSRSHKKPLILSYHNFDHTPPELHLIDIINAAKMAGADIVKLALTAKNEADLARLLDLLRSYRRKNLIVIAMGAAGVASRIMFPLFGSLITFAFLKKGNAPGQLSLFELVRELQRYSPMYARARAARRPGSNADVDTVTS